MFSEALRILDNNTAELMADRFKAQLDNIEVVDELPDKKQLH